MYTYLFRYHVNKQCGFETGGIVLINKYSDKCIKSVTSAFLVNYDRDTDRRDGPTNQPRDRPNNHPADGHDGSKRF